MIIVFHEDFCYPVSEEKINRIHGWISLTPVGMTTRGYYLWTNTRRSVQYAPVYVRMEMFNPEGSAHPKTLS